MYQNDVLMWQISLLDGLNMISLPQTLCLISLAFPAPFESQEIFGAQEIYQAWHNSTCTCISFLVFKNMKYLRNRIKRKFETDKNIRKDIAIYA